VAESDRSRERLCFIPSLAYLFPGSKKTVQRFLKNFMGVIQGLSSGSACGGCAHPLGTLAAWENAMVQEEAQEL
jgi:hypothetical protein